MKSDYLFKNCDEMVFFTDQDFFNQYINTKSEIVIGSSNYTNYQMELLKVKFDQQKKSSASYTFEEWNNWRKSDGFMCRTSDDCNWIHSELYCLNANTLASKIAQDFNLKTTLPEISLIVSVS